MITAMSSPGLLWTRETSVSNASRPYPPVLSLSAYASSITRTFPRAFSITAVVFSAVSPTAEPVKSLGVLSSTVPSERKPSAARIRPYSFAMVVFPVPGLPCVGLRVQRMSGVVGVLARWCGGSEALC